MRPGKNATREMLPLVLVVRVLLAVTIFAVLAGVFGGAQTVVGRLSWATDLEAARAVLGWPDQLDGLGRIYGMLALDFLFLLALGQVLWTVGLYLEARAGQRLQLVRWASWLTAGYMVGDALENVFALVLIHGIERGDWRGWARMGLLATGILKWVMVVGTGGMLAWTWWKWRKSGRDLLASARVRDLARLVFFLRLPLLITLVLGLLSPLALGPVNAFLGATLIYEPDWIGLAQLLLTCTLSNLAALAAIAQVAILLERGPERFESQRYSGAAKRRMRMIFQRSALLAGNLVCAVSVVGSGAVEGVGVGWTGLAVLAWVIGVGIAVVVAMMVDVIRNMLVFRGEAATGTVLNSYLVLPRGWMMRRWTKFLRGMAQLDPQGGLWLIAMLFRGLTWPVRKLRLVGFVAPGTRLLYPDIAGAIWILTLSSMVFFAAVASSQISGWSINTMASLILLLLLLGWLLTGVSFFFDRYRVPAIAAAVGLRLLLGFAPGTDYHFLHKEAPVGYRQTAAQMLGSRAQPVLVAASGGGIQAAGWMTAVLERLRAEDPSLKTRIAAVSAVSGGSVGAYLLGSVWDEPDWKEAVEKSRQSSLGRVSWALVGMDLFRPLMWLGSWLNPDLLDWDRGYALETDLEKRAGSREGLQEWGRRAGANFPVFLFNSTVVETGGPVTFSTGEFPSRMYLRENARPLTRRLIAASEQAFFAEACPELEGTDVSVSTAARLSASFPYVSPAARPKGRTEDCNFHFVDGGYYDNYGLVSLLQWLDDGLEALDRAYELGGLEYVRIVVIRGRNDEALALSSKEWGFVDQSSAPLQAFLNMRSYAQWQGGGTLLGLMQEKWRQRNVRIEVTPVIYQGPAQVAEARCGMEPLTWKLTAAQKRCIDEQAAKVPALEK